MKARRLTRASPFSSLLYSGVSGTSLNIMSISGHLLQRVYVFGIMIYNDTTDGMDSIAQATGADDAGSKLVIAREAAGHDP